jgi:hypothetical protein
MRDFTLKAYCNYLAAMQQNGFRFLLFREFIPAQNVAGKFCLVRHDVDRKPMNALRMAQAEKAMGIKATYYFRKKDNVYIPSIIRQIEAMGHEVGYHYESLSDTDGDIPKAVEDFKINLAEFRKICRVDTVSMHGRPLKPYDNRDIWRVPENHRLLKTDLGILGEVYLDIDYTDIAYINDTGRNWTSNESNRRDKVESKISADFGSGEELLAYLHQAPHYKIVFQIHPERWTDSYIPWTLQLFFDTAINFAKKIVR